MQLIDAGLRTKQEAMKRLIDGEVFYFDTRKIFFDASFGSESPFRVHYNKANHEAVNGFWDIIKSWSVEKPFRWEDDIDTETGTICWVTDNPSSRGCETRVALITGKDDSCAYVYRSTEGTGWKYARPVETSELLELP